MEHPRVRDGYLDRGSGLAPQLERQNLEISKSRAFMEGVNSAFGIVLEKVRLNMDDIRRG